MPREKGIDHTQKKGKKKPGKEIVYLSGGERISSKGGEAGE